jgi:hypothetical protein
MARIAHDPFSSNHLSPKATPGMVFDGYDAYNNPAKFRYVQFIDDVTYAVGHACLAASADFSDVTNDYVGGTAIGTAASATVPPMIVGFACSAVTADYYGYVQITGRSVCLTDGGVSAGNFLTHHATTDGGLDTMATGTEEQVVGWAPEADTGTAGTLWITGCPV